MELASQRDARDLRRGLVVNALGYAAKLGMPLLLALATRRYGAERWGVFVAAQALVLLSARVCLLGLDKAMLWWAAANEPAHVASALRRTLIVVTASAAVLSSALYAGSALLQLSFVPQNQLAALRIALLGLLPFVWSELLLHTSMGGRRMELQVAVRDTLNPLLQVLIAIAAFELGERDTGLAWGFVASHVVGALVAYVGVRRALGRADSGPFGGPLAPALLRYAWPLWLAEIANSLVLRLDTIVLTACVDARTLGVWGIVMQFANALRQIRRAFDPLVTAIAANIATRRDPARLAAAYARATELVSLTQLPLFAVLFTCAGQVLPLYGAEFSAGTVPLMVLSVFFLLNGAAGLAGIVLNGYGRSGFTLANTLCTLAVQYGLLRWLAPLYGLTGAAFAVGLALTITNGAQLVQMRIVTGSFNYSGRMRRAPMIGVCCAAVGLATWSLASGASAAVAHASACAASLFTYGMLLWATGRGRKCEHPAAACAVAAEPQRSSAS
jgi:O-antigen/teichoic acid export membrane protein